MQIPKQVRLLLAGDVMTGRGIDQILPHPGGAEIYEPYMRSAKDYVTLAEQRNGAIPQPVSFGYLWGEALAAMNAREPAFRVINLETAVTRCDDYWPGKGINYRMHPGNAPCLCAARVDACSLANNHVLDWGYAGLAETLETLHAAGLKTAGAGASRAQAIAPAILRDGNTRLLLFACGHPSSGVPESWAASQSRAGINLIGELSPAWADAIAQQVAVFRQKGDLAVISIHWGGNWGYRIPTSHRKFAHRLIDSGADLVFGHSSHHPLGIEIYRQHAILYGCGDLINDYEGISGHEAYRPQLRLLYAADLDAERGTLKRLELIPFEMRRFRLQRPSEADCDWLWSALARECRQLGSELEQGEGRESMLLRW